jgi:hypothetical protein
MVTQTFLDLRQLNKAHIPIGRQHAAATGATTTATANFSAAGIFGPMLVIFCYFVFLASTIHFFGLKKSIFYR